MKTFLLLSSKSVKNSNFPANFTVTIKFFRSEFRPISDLSPNSGDLSTCISSLQSCATQKNLIKGKQIHSWMVVNGYLTFPFCFTSLINMYSKCNRPNEALAIFNQTHNRNVYIWNAIVAGFATNGLSSETLDFYRKMLPENAVPDKFTFPCVIKACSDLPEFWEGTKIHGRLIRIGLNFDMFISSSLINFYLKCSFPADAYQVFDEMPKRDRDVVLWNAMMNGFAQIGQFDDALGIFQRMAEEGMVPSKFTVTGILSVFSATGDLFAGEKIHGFVEKLGYESDMVVCNSLIDMYGKCKDIEGARKVFRNMPCKDIVSWNSIISVCSQIGDHVGTLTLFDEMQRSVVLPDCITISSVLPACSHLAALLHGKKIHGYMILNGLRRKGDDSSTTTTTGGGGVDDDVYVDNAIMDMYTKCGSLRDAQLVFDKMHRRDVASWNIMIIGYGMHGHVDDALNLFASMSSTRVKPDEVTFVGVLSACSHAGLLDTGREILAHMESDHGVAPAIDHYACVVDMLGRAGRLGEAYELAINMPIEPNPVVWRAFLNACRLHGDAILGEAAAHRLFELEPEHCGSYVLLSNIYGAAGRYEDVSEVRRAMKRQNVRKTPGCSWIELSTGVHVFVTGDRTHPESDRLYAQLHVLSGQLRDSGYAPDLGNVWHNTW